MSLSNTLRPCRTWSSADCSRSRLYCSASDASSSSLRADWLPASPRRQQQRQHEPRRCGTDGARQQVLGEAQQVDVGLRVAASARVAARRHTPRTSAPHARRRDSGHGLLQVADGDAMCATCRKAARRPAARQIVEDEDVGLQALDRLGRPQQRHDDEQASMLAAMLQSTPCVSGSKLQVEQRLRLQEGQARTGRPSMMRARQPAGLG